MEFGIEKRAMLVIEKEKILKSVGIRFGGGEVIKSLQEGENYKYLRVLEEDRFLEEKLNIGKLVQGVNTCAMSLLRYTAAFISWSCLQYMEDCTQSLMLTDCIYLEKMNEEV